MELREHEPGLSGPGRPSAPPGPGAGPPDPHDPQVGWRLSQLAHPFALAIGSGATLGLLGLWALAWFPWRVERWYVEGFGPPVQLTLNALSALVPISLAEWLELGAGVAALVWLVALARALWRGRGRRGWVLLRAGGALWAALAAIGFWFYVAWGLAYARPPAPARLGWSDGEPLPEISTEELTILGDALVDKVNEAYLEVHGWPDAYDVTVAPDGVPAMDRAVDLGWERMVAAEGLPASAARSRGPTKPLLSSIAFTWLHIGGFYFPFTAEANINALQPEWQMAFTMAHEKAHQRFVASEDEANFFGFLACIHSEDPLVRYSGWLFAQRQILATLGQIDPYGFWFVIERRYPGVQRDVNWAHAFWSGYEGPVAKLGDVVNDRYLRWNGVDGGLKSYSQSLVLVVEWLRRHPDAWGR